MMLRSLSILIFIQLTACAPKPLSDERVGLVAGGDAVLATVDGREIRHTHFVAERDIADHSVLGRFRSETKQADLVASLVDREVLFAEGWRNDAIRGRAEVRVAVAEALARALVESEVRRSGSSEVVKDEEIRAAYGARKEEWKEPARMWIRSILRLWTPVEIAAKRDEQRALLTRVRAEIAAGGSFAQAAKVHNQDPENVAEGGDLGWFDVGSDVVPEGARALRARGDLSPVTEVGNGFRLFVVSEVTPARFLPIETVRESIRRDIVFARVRDRLITVLRAKR